MGWAICWVVWRACRFIFDPKAGELTPNDPAELQPPDDNTGPRHICLGPAGDVAYIVNEQGNAVTSHRLDSAKGTLEIFQNISSLPADHPGGNTAHIEVHPNGKWIYASNRPHDGIVGFNIAEDGSLGPFGHFPVPASPRSFNIDSTGSFLYCAGESADTMNAYRVDPSNGHLEQFDSYDVGKSPFWVMVVNLEN